MTSLFKKKEKKKESLKKREKKMDWVGSSTLRVRFGTIYLVKIKIFAESILNTYLVKTELFAKSTIDNGKI